LQAVQRTTLAAFPACVWQAELPLSTYQTPALFVVANELLDAFPVIQKNAADELTVIDLTDDGALRLVQPVGPLVEHSPAQTAWLLHLQSLPNLRAALLLDYGYSHVPPGQSIDTLQALHAHQHVPITHRPGETDLTTHVDFTHVARVLGPAHCTTQALGPFLLHHKMASLALAQNVPEAALHRLLHPSAMGGLFQVLEYMPT
jgi:SAM-dependent MidA family methyltransferase